MAILDDLSRRMNQSMDLNKLQASISAEDKYIRQAQEQIGERYVAMHLSDETFADYQADLMQGIRDAKARKEEYQNMIRRVKGVTVCPNCGTELGTGMLFCTRCGMRQASSEASKPGGFCTQCGQPVPAGSKFCFHCGAQLVSSSEEQPDKE